MVPESLTAVSENVSPSIFSSLSNNAKLIGPTWILSSAIFTTYSTTSFLKYKSARSSLIPPKKSNNNFSSLITKSHNQFKIKNRPALLIFYRFSGSLLCGLFVHSKPFLWKDRLRSTLSHIPDFTLPSLFLFLANFSNSIALDRIGISLTYTSKCGIPILTVLLTLLLDGWKALPSIATLLTLVPIAVGIALASWNSPTFESIGFICALISCTSQAALNVSSKRVLMRWEGMSGLEAQRAMVTVALGLTVGMQLLTVLINSFSLFFLAKNEDDDLKQKLSIENEQVEPNPPLGLSILAVISYHIEYVLSFMFVRLVEPITYGACDAMRRLAIILTGKKNVWWG